MKRLQIILKLLMGKKFDSFDWSMRSSAKWATFSKQNWQSGSHIDGHKDVG